MTVSDTKRTINLEIPRGLKHLEFLNLLDPFKMLQNRNYPILLGSRAICRAESFHSLKGERGRGYRMIALASQARLHLYQHFLISHNQPLNKFLSFPVYCYCLAHVFWVKPQKRHLLKKRNKMIALS